MTPTQDTVYLVEDDAEVRDLLSHQLSVGGFAVRAFASPEALLALVVPGMQGCVVTDVRMAPMDGVELTTRLRDLAPSMPVIAITGFADVGLAVHAMKAGARDFIEKSGDIRPLLDAITAVLRETNQMAQDVGSEREELNERLASLSHREREVLAWIGAGRSGRQIADRLGISGRTVDAHRARLMLKMRAPRLAHLVRMATLLDLRADD